MNDAFKASFFYSNLHPCRPNVGYMLDYIWCLCGQWCERNIFMFGRFSLYAHQPFLQGIFVEMFREYNICMMLQPLCFFIGMASLLFLGPEDVFFAGVNFFASHALTALLSVAWVLAKKNLMPEHPTKASFEKRLRYGLNTYAGNLLAFLNYRSDIYILGLFVAPISIVLFSCGSNRREVLAAFICSWYGVFSVFIKAEGRGSRE